MYQITLFFKEVIYKKIYLINIHQKISNYTNFLKFFWGSMPPTPPPAKSMASLSCDYVQRIALTHAHVHFRKKS